MKVAASIFFVTISLIINMTQLTAARHVSELARGVFKQRLLSIPDHPLQAPISNAAITIQKITRGVQNRRRHLIPSSTVQTKIWRQEQSWYMNGKKNECEIYQRNFIEKITNMKCAKSDKRLHIPTKILADNRYPMKEVDGFDSPKTLPPPPFIPSNLPKTSPRQTAVMVVTFICTFWLGVTQGMALGILCRYVCQSGV